MKQYIYLILNICLSISASLYEAKNYKEIKYKFRKTSFTTDYLKDSFNPELKISQENSLLDNNIIELESDYIITQISWTRKDNYKYNYLLGVFEGSNDPSFMDGIPIAIIKEQGNFNEINIIDINSPFSFKYIRYTPPNKNNTSIFPIKIYVRPKSEIKDENSENINKGRYFQVTNLPLVSIHTENSTEPGRDGDINCTITIINEGKIENSENASIKVRGRTTGLIPPKKPYRIKFSTKQKIFNFKGKEKKWTLIANHFDRSLLRNTLAFKISELMEFKFTPRCQPVDVILNGNFRGNYYICDKVDTISKNRINITQMEVTDISEPNITGGYLLQIDSYANFGKSISNFRTNRGIVGEIVIPEEDEITPEQATYIKDKLNQSENEIYNGILNSIDLESYSKYFLIEEFCGDPDHTWSSFYFTKDRDDDRFQFGPVWDFDLSFDNDERLIPTNAKTEFCFNYCDSAGTTRDFLKTLIGNKIIMTYIKNTWEELYENTLNENVLIDILEEKRVYIKESAELNFLKWDNFESDKDSPWHIDFGRKGENFEVSVEVVKDYVRNRFKSLTNLINNAISLLE